MKIKAHIAVLGKNHEGRDTIMVRVSKPFKELKDFPETEKFLLWPNEEGEYIYDEQLDSLVRQDTSLKTCSLEQNQPSFLPEQ